MAGSLKVTLPKGIPPPTHHSLLPMDRRLQVADISFLFERERERERAKMAVIGEAIAGAIIDKLVEMAFNYLKDQCGWQTGMPSELQRLKNALPRIQAVVDAAERGQLEMTGPLRAWLRQLKDALYDAEDVLDELDYFRLQKLAEASPADEAGSSKKKGKCYKVCALLSDSKKKLIRFSKRAGKADPTLKALREAVKRMDVVAASVGDFFQLLSFITHGQQLQGRIEDNRETGPLPTEDKVFGRDEQIKELLGWLMKTTQRSTDHNYGKNCFSLASLVGLGGMGKTTLARSVYNDPMIQSHFDLRVWVCISNTFNVNALTKKMLEAATGTKPEADSLGVLQDALKAKLMSSTKPVLVVLDDAWNDQSVSDWDTLLAPLKLGLPKGSKVLLTTRMQTVADAVEAALKGSTMEEPWRVHLDGLPKDDFLDLFNFFAFGGLDPNDDIRSKHIGEEIADRLGGLPLAAKVIGRMLNLNMRKEYWEAILSNSIFKSEPEGGQQEEIKSVLKLSYQHLGNHIRPCFVYCSVFPQDHEFKKDELVRMWMAVGLVPQSPNETLEETGGRYFDDLLRRSFFEPSKYGRSYIMHDLLHELARSLSGGECFRFEGNISVAEIPQCVRHLYFMMENDDDLKSLAAAEWLKNLRTLHLEVNVGTTERDELCRKILLITRHVRVLFTERCCALSLGIIIKLKHLRYLSTDLCGIDHWPTFCNYNLQSVSAMFHYNDVYGYGQSLKNLISLRHYKPRFIELSAVRKLTLLQELRFVVVGKESGSNNKIEELKDLNQLRELLVVHLENVTSEEEAGAAELHRKKHLCRLVLEWESRVGHHQHEGVFDGLQPHTSKLNELIISGYGGGRCASWMMTPTTLGENLQSIILEKCDNWECLPPFGKLRYLKVLKLERMPAVKRLDCDGGFQQLEDLRISALQNLNHLAIGGLDGGHQCFPRLCKFKIYVCPKLQVLPSLPLTTLVELDLLYVGLTELPELKIPRGERDGDSNLISNTTPSSSLSSINIVDCRHLRSAKSLLQRCRHPLLEHLEIRRCPQLADPQVPPQTFGHLQEVVINDCGEWGLSSLSFLEGGSTCLRKLRVPLGSSITSLPSQEVWLLQNCISLEILSFSNASSLQSLPADIQLLSSLKELVLGGVYELKSLPADIHRLSSLIELVLRNATQLNSLPLLPASLQVLIIYGANETLRERCRKDEGADWPNIKHIPTIILYEEMDFSEEEPA